MLAAFFGPAVWQGKLLALGDSLAYYLPARSLAATSMLAGDWPFWNPYGFGGLPLHGMLQAGAFYPGNAAFLFFGTVPAMAITVVSAFALAGLTLYGYMRAIDTPPAGAVFAGLAYMLAGCLVAHLEHLTFVQTAALLPGMLWSVERFRRTMEARYALAGAVLIALQLFAGYPQTTEISLILCAVYGLARGVGLDVAGWRRYLGTLAAATLLGVGLAAVQLLPARDVLLASERLARPYEELVALSLPPRQLTSFLFPYLFGGPTGPLFPMPYWGAGTFFVELTGYVGLGTLVAALIALGQWRLDRYVRIWSGFAAAAIVLVLGGNTPLYRLWLMLPFMNNIRVPGRHLLELDLALAVLAGLGFAAVVAAPAAERWRWVWRATGMLVGAVASGILGLAILGDHLAARVQPWLPPGFPDMHVALALWQPAIWVPAFIAAATVTAFWALAHRPGAFAQALCLVVLFGDLLVFGQNQGWAMYCTVPATQPVLAVRVSTPDHRFLAMHPSGYPYMDLRLSTELVAPGVCALLGEREAAGIEGFMPARTGRLLGDMAIWGAVRDYRLFADEHHVLDLMGVRMVRFDRSMVDEKWRQRLAPPRWKPVAGSTRVAIYENVRALPRAWRPAQVTVLSATDVDRRATGDLSFEPANEALVEAMVGPGPFLPGTVSVTPDGLNRLVVQTHGSGPGFVVINEGFDPGWSATLAGKALPVYRVDGLVMGVPVPAGDHRVTLAFEPRGWWLGSRISAVSFFAFMAWAFLLALGNTSGATRRRRG